MDPVATFQQQFCSCSGPIRRVFIKDVTDGVWLMFYSLTDRLYDIMHLKYKPVSVPAPSD